MRKEHVGLNATRTRRAIVTFATGGVVLSLAGCGLFGESRENSNGAAIGELGESAAQRRLDVAWGTTVVAPAAVVGQLKREELAGARMDDGRPVRFAVRWLGASVGEQSTEGWLPPVGVWSIAEQDPRKGGSESGTRFAEFVVLSIPSGAGGQSVWVGDRRLELSWLQSSVYLTDTTGITWESPLTPDVRGARLVQRAAADEAKSPFRRWRSRLVNGELAPRELHTTPDEPDTRPDVFESKELELIASQVEERWRVGLARLYAADKQAYRRLVSALTACANLGGLSQVNRKTPTELASVGEWVPVWPTDQRKLDELLAQLLIPNQAAGLFRRVVEDFVETLPRGAAWPADYAAGIDAKLRAPIPSVGLANFSSTSIVAAAKPLSNPVSPGLVTVVPMVGLPLPVWPWEGCPPLDKVRCDVGLGVSVSVPLASTPVKPPGLLLGPLMMPWRLDSLAAGEPQLSPLQPVAVSLMRAASPSPAARPESAGWLLYIERDSRVASARVEVWTGSAGSGKGPMIVDVDGPRIKTVEVPRDAVVDGLLVVGLRVSAKGATLTWPLPVFPWADEPARQSLDLRAWSGLDVGTR